MCVDQSHPNAVARRSVSIAPAARRVTLETYVALSPERRAPRLRKHAPTASFTSGSVTCRVWKRGCRGAPTGRRAPSGRPTIVTSRLASVIN